MNKPWIGIPTRYHEKSEYVGQIRHYLDAVQWAGGLPLMIPTTADKSSVLEYIKRVQGILLPGSPTDVDPARYSSSRHEKLGRLSPEREALDFTILDYVESNDLPLLGICYGIQSLNVHRGGTLIQDIPSLVSNNVSHDASDEKPPARHLVRIEEGSLISKFAEQRQMEVNSYHHQAIDRPGDNLRAVAFAPDGVIEAVEDAGGRFVIGVQWHPEREWRESAFSKALFSSLIAEARVRYN